MPLEVSFSNNTNPAYVGSCAWDFGDGGTSSATCDPTYVFETAGIYSVLLTVTTPWGCTGDTTICDMITVYALPVPVFTAEPDSGCYPLEVTFTNTTAGVAPDGCAWTFGDGSIGAPRDPVYTYPEPGVYDVSLTVTTPEGCVADTLLPAVHHGVRSPRGPTLTSGHNPRMCSRTGDPVSVNTSSQDAILWDWAFGADGVLGTSTVPNPTSPSRRGPQRLSGDLGGDQLQRLCGYHHADRCDRWLLQRVRAQHLQFGWRWRERHVHADREGPGPERPHTSSRCTTDGASASSKPAMRTCLGTVPSAARRPRRMCTYGRWRAAAWWMASDACSWAT